MKAPSLPVFMATVLQPAGADAEGWVAHFTEPPAPGASWGGYRVAPEAMLKLNGSQNAYFSIAAFGQDARARTKQAALGVPVIVADDVGTKADPEHVRELLGAPSYSIETSPGNFQWGYLLDKAYPTDKASAVYRLLGERGLSDKSGLGPVRYARLPCGYNNKPGLDEPFHVELRAWNPERRFSLAEIERRLTVDDAATPAEDVATATTDNAEALAAARFIAEGENDLKYDPWIALGHKFKAALGDAGRELWLAFSAKFADYDERLARKKWDSFKPETIGAGALLAFARERGYVSGGRVAVIVERGKLHEAVHKTLAAVAPRTQALRLFASGNRLVTTHHVERDGFQGPDGAPERVQSFELLNLGSASLMMRLAEAVEFREPRAVKGGKSRLVTVDPPSRVVEAIATAPDTWAALPRIDRITQTPLIRNGALISGTGLHGNVYVRAPDVKLPEVLDRNAAQGALDYLLGWLDEFPFATEVDKAAALAMLLTAAVRASIDTAPGVLVTKPSFGAGATTLCKLAGVVAIGSMPAVLNASEEGAEFTKMFGGALLVGLQLLMIDNVPEGSALQGTLFAQVLTERTVGIRPLGRSEIIDCDTGRLVVATGVNVSVAADLQRRMLQLRLDPRLERPEARTFKRADIVGDALRDRVDILRALYTVSLAYQRSGKSAKVAPYAGYAQWRQYVAAPLVWLGLPDIIEAARPAVADDPTAAALGRLLPLWKLADPKGRGLTLKDATAAPERLGDEQSTIGQALSAVLIDATDARPVGGVPTLNTKAAGEWLRRVAGRVVNGHRIVRGGVDRTGAARWIVEQVQGPQGPAGTFPTLRVGGISERLVQGTGRKKSQQVPAVPASSRRRGKS